MLKIGHRGAMGYEPENTIASFKKAIELKADMIELDVHLCKTGEIIVIHDETLDRTTNGKGKIITKTLSELKKLRIENKYSIPTLEEVIDLSAGKIKINIELKGPGTEKSILNLIQKKIEKNIIKKEDLLISSFDYDKLNYIRKNNLEIPIGLLVKKDNPEIWFMAKRLNATSLNIPVEQVSTKLIKKAHENKLKVLVWTVNATEDIKRLKNLKVDGIFSNYPDRL